MAAAPQRRKVHFETWGCTTNLGDTRTMEGLLLQAGHELVASVDEADLVVLNTCTVIDTTDARIGHRLRTLQEAGKDLVVAGCMAAARPDLLRREAPGVPLLGPRDLHQVADLVAGRPLVVGARPKSGLPRTLGATDAIIQVSEGCLFTCSYCITKTARGDQTSHPIDDLVADVRDAVNAGAVDIKLTSQDTSGYGFDGGPHLPELVRRITEIGGDFRVRIGMMHPRTAFRTLDDLLDAMDHPKVYKFLHLPIQTGSPRILAAMNRGNTLEEFWAVIAAFRARFPAPGSVVSTDIIVAFPGETEDDHRLTYRLLERLQAEHVNITRFSARPGTPAKTLADRVPTEVAKRRSTELTHLVWSGWDQTNPGRVGETLELYVLEPGKRPGTMLCRGPAYEPVVVRQGADDLPLGSRLRARIVAARTTYFIAERVGPVLRAQKVAAAWTPGRPLPVLPVVP